MNNAITAITVIVAGLVALSLASPRIIAVLHALIPLVLVVGICAVLIRVIWTITDRW